MGDLIGNSALNPSASSKDEDGKSTQTKVVRRKRHMYSQVEGEYYCTYLIDNKGKRILISQIPVSQMPALGLTVGEDSDFEKVRKQMVQQMNRGYSQQQQVTEATVRKLTAAEMMSMLNVLAGTSNQTGGGQNGAK